MYRLNLSVKNHYIPFILICSLFFSFSLVGQEQGFISFGSGVYSIGIANGIQPNYRSGQGDVFVIGSLNQNVTIKNIPLTFSTRLSDEPYISGRASFFRISYDANTAQKNKLDKLQLKKNRIDSLFILEQDTLYKIQQKISYFKLKELEAINHQRLNLDSLNSQYSALNLDSIYTLNSIKNDSFESLSKVEYKNPDFDFELNKYENLLNIKLSELNKLEKEKAEINKKYEEVTNKVHQPFFQGIKKADIGLTSLPKSNFSKNTLPIRGVHLKGEINKFNYDLASGFSFPNQLFSSQVSDQVLLNSSNIFNLTSFFKVDNIRFVNSGIIEYGEKSRNSILVEDFYTGKSFNQITNHEDGERSNVTNIGAYYTPKILPNLTLSIGTGMCTSFNDTIKRSLSDQSSQNVGVELRFLKIKGVLSANYKKIGNSYKGFSQGIYLSGFVNKDIEYKQKISKRISSRIYGSESRFQFYDSSTTLSFMRQGTIDLNAKIGSQSLIYVSGTLIDSKSDTASFGLSYLMKSGIIANKKLNTTNWNSSIDYTNALIKGGDSTQKIEQYNIKSGLKFSHFYFGIKVTYQYYAGLIRVYGVNKTIQPEIGISYKKLDAKITYQYLQSDQFGKDNGLTAFFNFRPSTFFAWQFTLQRWTKSELNFFINEKPEYIKPLFMNINAIITIK